MNILTLVKHGFGESGGIAQYTKDLLETIVSSRHCTKLTVVAQTGAEVDLKDVPAEIEYLNVNLGNKFGYLLRVAKLMRRKNFDLLICTHLHLLPVAFLVKIFQRSKVVLIVYGIEAWSPRSFLNRKAVCCVDIVVSISNFTLNRMKSWMTTQLRKEYILPPTISKLNFYPGDKPSEIVARCGLKDRQVIFTISRLEPGRHKGHDLLIELMPELIATNPNLVYLIAGTGPDKLRLENKVSELGVASNVKFLGFVSEVDKLSYYQVADVFYMAGEGEGFGIVYLEAFACGLPVIASSLDASSEVINNISTGLLINPFSSEELRSAVARALKFKKEIPSKLEEYYTESYQEKVDLLLDIAQQDRR